MRRRRYGTRRATPAQISYLRRLLNQAFAQRVTGGPNLDAHHLDQVPFAEASAAIDRLRELLGIRANKARGVAGNDSAR